MKTYTRKRGKREKIIIMGDWNFRIGNYRECGLACMGDFGEET